LGPAEVAGKKSLCEALNAVQGTELLRMDGFPGSSRPLRSGKVVVPERT